MYFTIYRKVNLNKIHLCVKRRKINKFKRIVLFVILKYIFKLVYYNL